MQVWRSPDDVPGDLDRTVVTIGVFDGVHRGHRVVLDRAVEAARAARAPLVVVTFDPHPMAVVRPEQAPPAVTSLDHRLDLLAAAGADAALVLPFDRERAAQHADDFVVEVLVGRLHAVAVVVGEDFRFGHRAAGDIGLLRRLGAGAGFETVAVPLAGPEGSRWSSSAVRALVGRGDVAGAAEVLGRPVRVEGTVVQGDRRGRGLGYPTANLDVPEGVLLPADGVYAGRLRLLDDRPDDAPTGPPRRTGPAWPAAVSVGTNPTFGGGRRRVEAYVLDRDDLELYGRRVAVEMAERVRGMERFDSVPDLVERMGRDVERVREILGYHHHRDHPTPEGR